ncbi:MAG: NAD(P) transhydrogenase subunit alpha [Acidimicrobiia bacterium]|nr:NAD(P) transhydrogenase subunit alpha [Acidimicrobiia bacterium]
MRLVVHKEAHPDERRVAVTPRVASLLGTRDIEVVVATGAGSRAGFPDEAYAEAGATVADNPGGDINVLIGPPSPQFVAGLPEGSVLIGFLDPFTDTELLAAITAKKLTAIAFEAVPRTTLAQMMDALSSQATAAGYAAVLNGAAAASHFLPMLTTAAGTIPPAKVLVLGTGVAGLQAIATARRLGAVTSAYDIRPEAREQVESLGAKFVAAPTAEEASTEGGYAKEVATDMQQLQLAALAPVVAESDLVIATAQIPGRPAPLLVTTEMVAAMRPGSVVVDLAAATGGNCEATVADTEVDINGVTVLGPTDLPSRVAADASEMYARNLASLLELIVVDGELTIDLENEIMTGACVAHAGEVRHALSRRALGIE